VERMCTLYVASRLFWYLGLWFSWRHGRSLRCLAPQVPGLMRQWHSPSRRFAVDSRSSPFATLMAPTTLAHLAPLWVGARHILFSAPLAPSMALRPSRSSLVRRSIDGSATKVVMPCRYLQQLIPFLSHKRRSKPERGVDVFKWLRYSAVHRRHSTPELRVDASPNRFPTRRSIDGSAMKSFTLPFSIRL